MDLKIKEINNKEIWENFLFKCKEKTFLDSWSWGEFQKKGESNIWRFGVFKNNEIIACALVVEVKARRGNFLFIPHGPIVISHVRSQMPDILNTLLVKIKEIAKDRKASFIRIAPIFKREIENILPFKKLKFRDAPIHIHPEVTWELDITLPEQKLLNDMRKTTRYLIKQGIKNKNIEIIQNNDIKNLKIFNEIYKETATRNNFTPFSLKYLENEFLAFDTDKEISIFLGKLKDKVVSVAIVVFWQNMAFYHHSGSLSKYRKIPVSYLLQWQVIKEAKKRGCQLYNFWGIAPEIENKSQILKSKHPWAGLTLFKMGFGGKRKEYVKTQDMPLSFKYWLICLFERLRRAKRRL
jgi:peptidoglycan pentaglycine glycine transferase (the first glycine)